MPTDTPERDRGDGEAHPPDETHARRLTPPRIREERWGGSFARRDARTASDTPESGSLFSRRWRVPRRDGSEGVATAHRPGSGTFRTMTCPTISRKFLTCHLIPYTIC
jgi:hypothetical protein